MESDNSFLSHLITVKESILDEEKLVTYVSLSKDLCIHVNDCKILLRRAIENIRKEQPKLQLNISYIISGICDLNKARLIVCPENELDQVRRNFKTIFFEHVYSIGKGMKIDNNSILLLHKFEDFVLSKGLIKNSECIRLGSDDLNNFKEKRHDYNIPKETESAKVTLPKLKKESNSPVVENTGQLNKDKSNSQVKNETHIKSESDPQSKQVNGNQSSHKITNPKNKKGIAGFFTKSIANVKKPTEVVTNDIQSKSVKVEKMDFEEMDIDEKEIDNITKEKKVAKNVENVKNATEKIKKEVETDNTVETNKKSKTPNKVEKNKKVADKSSYEINKTRKSNQIKKPTKIDKNRKRVLQVSESDSEEENDPFANKQNILEDSDDEIPPTPMANNIKITSGLVNPKKKRKIVDKTYMSEDGYILTKKEEIYESCSDNEEKEELKIATEESSKEKNIKQDNFFKSVNEVKKEKDISPVKKNGKRQSKKQISPPKGKQATMTSFFKRK